ncbi:MAG: bifunctional (p)ppGpp synthetase/guanosine-3',5'-bis(diphosphate) 3'-pyrophosphohydrolase [Spirochaetales bacterium]|nr:bifunctional (p)ppGpp synthetase/guanosine-3',5'-bis(diphosphate) 3'-pyrophosphohydrolase [Spirochaetales bacterium]
METLLKRFGERLNEYTERERTFILDAAHWAKEQHQDQKRASGDPFFVHPLQVAEILVNMRMDAETIVAALLHDILEDTKVTKKEMQERFGKEVLSLVNGVTKISVLKSKSKNEQETETIRKMLFAMTKDIRVIIIKLADKLHNMGTLQHLKPERQKEIASECLDIYAPLAGRLGISWLKAELEDLALKHLNADVYSYIKESMAARKEEREDYLKEVERAIRDASLAEGIKIQITTRAKHFFSIYKKMKKRNKEIDSIYDLLGIRILCDSESECYTILGLVHKLWLPIEGRFKDYIAMPKSNQYRSLHTTVMGYKGRLIEIQIRTRQMHWTAEYGVAAHWAYKKGRNPDRIKPEDLLIINKLKSWNGKRISSGEFLEEIKRELLKDSIYVFTPKGHIIELPKHATPIDFAYHIHTEVGNHCIGAKADGSIIPLTAELKNTQVIDIMTSRNAHPHLNWLKFVKTSRARTKIRQWLNRHDDNLIIDRNIIAKKKAPHPPEEQKQTPPQEVPPEGEQIVKRVYDSSKVVFKIGGEKNMLISIARCCNPISGDAIIGYVSRGRGIIVHKKNCPNLKHINDFSHRSIEVEWEAATPKATKRFRVTAKMTGDLFSEIEGAIRKYKGHLIEGRLEENERGNLTGSFIMELDRGDDYKMVMKSIRTIPSVLNIQSS